MPSFEYKVVPAPKKGLKAKGVKSIEDRFANAMASVMNELAAEGWEYQRSDTLPCEERSGFRGRSTTFQNILVFRRAIPAHPEQSEPVSTEPTAAAQAAPIAAAPATTPPRAPTPLGQATPPEAKRAAPSLGPATTDAVEVRDPRVDSTT